MEDLAASLLSMPSVFEGTSARPVGLGSRVPPNDHKDLEIASGLANDFDGPDSCSPTVARFHCREGSVAFQPSRAIESIIGRLVTCAAHSSILPAFCL